MLDGRRRKKTGGPTTGREVRIFFSGPGPTSVGPHALAFNDDGDGAGAGGEDGNEGSEGGSSGDDGPTTADLLQDQLEAARAKNRELESRLEDLEEDDPEGLEEDDPEADPEELKEIKRKLREEREQRKQLEEQRKQDRIDQKLRQKALDAGMSNPDTYLELVPRGEIALEDGEVKGADAAVEQLKESAPEIFQEANPSSQEGDDGADDQDGPTETTSSSSGRSKPSDRDLSGGDESDETAGAASRRRYEESRKEKNRI